MSLFGVDVGGTFTDVVVVRDGRIEVTKVPSFPADPQRSVVEGARRLGVADGAIFNHASTKGLNAILTRKLPKIAFLTTDGHRDMLDAGRTWRPFDGQLDAKWRRPYGDAARPLVPRYLRRGVRERILSSGEVLIPFDAEQARAELQVLKRCAVEGVAICLLSSYVSGAHEQLLKALVREVLGDIPVSVSSEISPRAKEFSRAATTVIDVIMKLLYGDYATKLHANLGELGFRGDLNFADCTASLLPWREALNQPYKILFAGPAAGTASCQRLGLVIGEPRLICCDVGGTSTDVSLILDGQSFTNDSFEIEHDLVVSALSTEVASIGAGGGSLVAVSASGDITVGPQSAGASPGPACYGRGGTLPTVTDACLLMGILEPRGFAGGQLELDVDAAQRAFAQLDTPLPLEKRIGYAYQIAVNNIAEEVTNVAIRHGGDPRDFSLVAYGSAGPMLLGSAIDMLNVRRVIVPPHPGLFSAIGLLSTDLTFSDSRSSYLLLGPESAPKLAALFAEMEKKLLAAVGNGTRPPTLRRSFDGRLLGQTWETPFVEVPDGPITADTVAAMIGNFHVEYARRNGRSMTMIPVQGVSYRVQVIVPVDKFEYRKLPAAATGTAPQPIGRRRLLQLAPAPLDAGIFERAALAPGMQVAGPAIIQEPLCTTLVGPGQTARCGDYGELYIEKAGRP
ncbi:MAG TPA: hydantoinase/oxoprolinase family protein [Steroidobacteraceae bacterium]|nr:hydantoinase/oxoprolinase family protein [Steroidobacteraceae bacterium]